MSASTDFVWRGQNPLDVGYLLLFKACGYYSTFSCLASAFLESCAVFLMKALHWLPSLLTITRTDLERVMMRLYRKEGFFVEISSDEAQTN